MVANIPCLCFFGGSWKGKNAGRLQMGFDRVYGSADIIFSPHYYNVTFYSNMSI